MRLAAVFLVLLLACHDSTAPIGFDLAREQAQWQLKGIRNYDFEFGGHSEWFPPEQRPLPWVVEVRNGVVSRVRTRDGKTVETSDWYPSPPTIDSLFARAIRFAASDQDPDVDAAFDPVLHYVRYLMLDHPGWADDAIWIYAENLVRR